MPIYLQNLLESFQDIAKLFALGIPIMFAIEYFGSPVFEEPDMNDRERTRIRTATFNGLVAFWALTCFGIAYFTK